MDLEVPIAPFISVDDLAALEAPVILADVRWYPDGRSGHAAYEEGHLPGAVFVDFDRWMTGPATAQGGRNPLSDPEVFSRGMAQSGIADASTVVAYDDLGGIIAARLVWMLRVTGRRAALLDGGLAAFDGALSLDEPRPKPAVFSVRPWPAAALAEVEDLFAPGVLPVDARHRDRFEGERQDAALDPRAGHIPGAVNVPCRENLGVGGRLLPAARVLANFALAGIRSAESVVAYCGSGVSACHNLLAMEHVGLGRGRLYVGGWSAYGADESQPVETGAAQPGRIRLK